MNEMNANGPASRKLTFKKGLLLGVEAVLFILLILYLSLRSDYEFGLKARPHVIILLADSLRADHLGCYGYQLETSPTIDGLARSGVLFERAIAPAPWTKPSVASLFTSRLPSSHGVTRFLTTATLKDVPELHGFDRLPDSMLTLAEVFEEQGYLTLAVSANWWVDPVFGLDQGFTEFFGLSYNRDAGSDGRQLTYTNLPASHLNKLVFDWLDANDYRASKWFEKLCVHRKPLLVYIHYMDVHGPYSSPGKYDAMFDSHFLSLPIEPLNELDLERLDYLDLGFTNRNLYRSRYDGQIAYFDMELKNLFDSLGSRGILDRALLVLTADHGESLGEHGAWGHGDTLFQTEVHVPLIVSGLEGIELGTRVRETISLIDLAPTLCQVLGIAQPDDFEGVSLLDNLRGKQPGPSRAWTESSKNKTLLLGRVEQNRKWIFKTEDLNLTDIYNLDTDPLESVNLYRQIPQDTAKQMQDKTMKQLKLLRTRSAQTGEVKPAEITDQIKKDLESLGYLK